MRAYKETVTLDDLQCVQLKKPLPLRKGQRVEVLILVVEDDLKLELVREGMAAQGIPEDRIEAALSWVRTDR